MDKKLVKNVSKGNDLFFEKYLLFSDIKNLTMKNSISGMYVIFNFEENKKCVGYSDDVIYDLMRYYGFFSKTFSENSLVLIQSLAGTGYNTKDEMCSDFLAYYKPDFVVGIASIFTKEVSSSMDSLKRLDSVLKNIASELKLRKLKDVKILVEKKVEEPIKSIEIEDIEEEPLFENVSNNNLLDDFVIDIDEEKLKSFEVDVLDSLDLGFPIDVCFVTLDGVYHNDNCECLKDVKSYKVDIMDAITENFKKCDKCF